MADIRSDASEVFHYDIPDHPVFVRKNNIIAQDVFEDISIHWHDEIELIYVTSGSIRYRLNKSVVRIGAGEGIFVNSRQLHLIVSDNSDCELYCLIFHPTILCTSNYVARQFVTPVIENKGITYLMLSIDNDWQNRILSAIKSICEPSVESGNELTTMKYLFEIWNEIYSNMPNVHEAVHSDNEDLVMVKAMVSFIQNNYTGKIDLKKICLSGGVGKSKCTTLFNQYLNMTPMEYVNCYRIDKCCILLRDTDKSMTQIAVMTGFADASYFSKVFKNLKGVSPLAYRKREENEIDEN